MAKKRSQAQTQGQSAKVAKVTTLQEPQEPAPKRQKGPNGSSTVSAGGVNNVPVEGLRKSYKGYCHFSAPSSDLLVDRRSLSSLTPQKFFEEYIKPRKPVILEVDTSSSNQTQGPLEAVLGLKNADWAKSGPAGTQALLETAAAKLAVVAERRTKTDVAFGQTDSNQRWSTTLGDVCQDILSGSELVYLTTQPIPEEDNGCPATLAAPHVVELLRGAERLTPEIVGKLALIQLNLWMGRSASGSTSGLHHDYHDNIYALLRGEKEFRLFSPACLDLLKPVGTTRCKAKLHANGLICYAPGVREDGAPEGVIREWKQEKAKTGGGGLDSSDEDEALLDAMLEERAAKKATSRKKSKLKGNADDAKLPDSFCKASTDPEHNVGNQALDAPLASRALRAPLKEGDLLYLPASWFHEVISRGADAGGHLALNFWMAPPSSEGNFEKPYEDDFWIEKSQALLQATGIFSEPKKATAAAAASTAAATTTRTTAATTTTTTAAAAAAAAEPQKAPPPAPAKGKNKKKNNKNKKKRGASKTGHEGTSPAKPAPPEKSKKTKGQKKKKNKN